MLWFSLVEVIWQWWQETVSRLPDSLCLLSDSLHCMPWQLPCFSYSFTLLLHWIYDKAESFSTLKKHIWWAQTKLANINWEIWGSFVPTISLIISESVIPRVILIHKTLTGNHKCKELKHHMSAYVCVGYIHKINMWASRWWPIPRLGDSCVTCKIMMNELPKKYSTHHCQKATPLHWKGTVEHSGFS